MSQFNLIGVPVFSYNISMQTCKFILALMVSIVVTAVVLVLCIGTDAAEVVTENKVTLISANNC